MFRSLKALFEDGLARLKDLTADIDPMPLAVAALLLEVARADDTVDDAERREVLAAIARFCDLDEKDLDTLMTTAAEAVDAAVSFYDFTSTVNERLSREQKMDLLEMMWRVAQADGRVDHYEEYYIRKLSDLLYLSHGDFIRAKLKAAGEL
ncbi:MAG: TerB family tellurite resistance protein [Gammaproteobacteria bacterium]|jgi:uncharacterized tellurite resistance protein B-like protein|nr:TerB family tellurite resistance protein [Gammaproteobacteria bacterium]